MDLIVKENGGLPLLTFPGLAGLAGLTHAVTTRHGGVSAPPRDSLNLAPAGDAPPAVAANLARLRRALGLTRLVWASQVHGTRILAVRDQDGVVGEADGLATDQPGVGLLIKQADCQAVILAAPERGVVACLHVGWRGNVADMPGQGVRFLARRFGVAPGELWAAVSPGLGACCAEFVNHAREFPPEFRDFRRQGDNFDLPAITRAQLARAGVAPERIELAEMCTKCRPEFFSYRREGETGRSGTVVALV